MVKSKVDDRLQMSRDEGWPSSQKYKAAQHTAIVISVYVDKIAYLYNRDWRSPKEQLLSKLVVVRPTTITPATTPITELLNKPIIKLPLLVIYHSSV